MDKTPYSEPIPSQAPPSSTAPSSTPSSTSRSSGPTEQGAKSSKPPKSGKPTNRAVTKPGGRDKSSDQLTTAPKKRGRPSKAHQARVANPIPNTALPSASLEAESRKPESAESAHAALMPAPNTAVIEPRIEARDHEFISAILQSDHIKFRRTKAHPRAAAIPSIPRARQIVPNGPATSNQSLAQGRQGPHGPRPHPNSPNGAASADHRHVNGRAAHASQAQQRAAARSQASSAGQSLAARLARATNSGLLAGAARLDLPLVALIVTMAAAAAWVAGYVGKS